jgi:hypothetical protein
VLIGTCRSRAIAKAHASTEALASFSLTSVNMRDEKANRMGSRLVLGLLSAACTDAIATPVSNSPIQKQAANRNVGGVARKYAPRISARCAVCSNLERELEINTSCADWPKELCADDQSCAAVQVRGSVFMARAGSGCGPGLTVLFHGLKLFQDFGADQQV